MFEISKTGKHNRSTVSQNGSFNYEYKQKTRKLSLDENESHNNSKKHRRTIKQSTNHFQKPRNLAENNKRLYKNMGYLMSDNIFDNARKNELKKKERINLRRKYKDADINKKNNVKSPVYFTYEQTAYNYEPPIRFTEIVKEQERLHKRSRDNHSAQGSQESNPSKTRDVESTVINRNLEFLKKSVEMFKNQKETNMNDFKYLSRVTPSAIRNKKLSKRTIFPNERNETLIESKYMDRSKQNESVRTIESRNPSFNSLSSNENRITTQRSTKRSGHTQIFNEDFPNSKVSNYEPSETSDYYINSCNTLDSNSQSQSSRTSIETTNDNKSYLGNSLNSLKTAKKTLISGYYSSKQQYPILKTDEIKNKFSKRTIYPEKRTGMMMKSKKMNKSKYNKSRKRTALRNPNFQSMSSRGNRISTHRSTKRSHRTQNFNHGLSNSKILYTKKPPEISEYSISSCNTQLSQKPMKTTNKDKFYLRRSSNQPQTTNKTSFLDYNGYYSSKKQYPNLLTTIKNNEFLKRTGKMRKSNKMNKSKYIKSQKRTSLRNPNRNKITTHRSIKRNRSNKDFLNLKVLNTNEPSTTCEYYLVPPIQQRQTFNENLHASQQKPQMMTNVVFMNPNVYLKLSKT